MTWENMAAVEAALAEEYDVEWRVCDWPSGCQEWAIFGEFRCELHRLDPAFED